MIVTLPFSADFSDGSLNGYSALTTPTVVLVSGQSFSRVMRTTTRDTFSAYVPAPGNLQILVGGWLNASGLTGHPADGNPWTVGLGIFWKNAAGTVGYQSLTSLQIASGTGWTYVSATLTTDPTCVAVAGWVQIAAFPVSTSTYFAQVGPISFQPLPAGQTLIAVPGTPGFVEASLSMSNSVAIVESPYSPANAQAQQWPGADYWSLEAKLPKMTDATAGNWRGFFGELRGRLNVFQAGDSSRLTPLGVALGSPVVNGTVSGGNAPFSTTLLTRGWRASVYRQLVAGDYLQVGYRLHMVTSQVNSDANGNASLTVFPSLRETPADGTFINLINPVGIFRLASNMRSFHLTVDHLSQISLQAREQQ